MAKQSINEGELQQIVDAIVNKRRLGDLKPHELLDSLHRKKLPAEYFSIVEPLLHVKDGATYKYAIDIVGKMKGTSEAASDAVESAWRDSWLHGVPQACTEAFRALVRMGGNDERLISMIEESLLIDNYAIHKDCVDTLMKIEGGNAILKKWDQTLAGQCDCHQHQKLAAKVAQHLQAN